MFSTPFSHLHLKVIKRQKYVLIGVGSDLGARDRDTATEEGLKKRPSSKIIDSVQNWKLQTALLTQKELTIFQKASPGIGSF